MPLFNKDKSTISKIGNGQQQSQRIPTLPGTNVPFRNEEQYQRFQGNRIPASVGVTDTSRLTSNPNDNPSAFGPNPIPAKPVKTSIAPEEMGVDNMSPGYTQQRIPQSQIDTAIASFTSPQSAQPSTVGKLAMATGTTTQPEQPRGIPLAALQQTQQPSQSTVPVGLIGEPAIGSPQRIPAQPPRFDDTLSLQQQIANLEQDYSTKISDLYSEGGLRGMTAGAAGALEGGLRASALNELTPLQSRLELLQEREAAETASAQQTFENQLALDELAIQRQKATGTGSSNIDFSQPLQLSQAQQALFQASGIDPATVAGDPIARAMMATTGGRTLTQGELESNRELFAIIDRVGAITNQLSGNKKGELSALDKKDTGPLVGLFRSINPFDVDAQTFKSSIIQTVPGLARGVFGEVGVLTDTDMKRYASVLPNLKNTEEVNNALALMALSGLKNQLSTTIATYAGGGRDVSGLTPQYMKVQGEIKRLESTLGVPPEGFEIADEIDGTKYFLGPDGNYYTIEEALEYQPSFNQAVPQDLGTAMQKIKAVESSGNYQARGPVVTSGQYAGQRALGAYQVMPGNLPQWSQEALGRQVSEQEFLQNPQIQDAIVAHQFTKNYQKYGNWDDAASVWFTGRPLARAGTAADVTGTTVQEYINRFNLA